MIGASGMKELMHVLVQNIVKRAKSMVPVKFPSHHPSLNTVVLNETSLT